MDFQGMTKNELSVYWRVFMQLLSFRSGKIAELAKALDLPEEDVRVALERMIPSSFVSIVQETMFFVTADIRIIQRIMKQSGELIAQAQIDASMKPAISLDQFRPRVQMEPSEQQVDNRSDEQRAAARETLRKK